jgi:hypothetical protein
MTVYNNTKVGSMTPSTFLKCFVLILQNFSKNPPPVLSLLVLFGIFWFSFQKFEYDDFCFQNFSDEKIVVKMFANFFATVSLLHSFWVGFLMLTVGYLFEVKNINFKNGTLKFLLFLIGFFIWQVG